MIDKIIELDKALMIFLNKNISNSLFDVIMPIITSKDSLTIIGLILIFYLVLFCGKRGRIAILVLIFAAGASDAICAQIIKPWIGRIRPSHEFIEFINLLVSKGGEWSFPSNHAANSFAFATVLSYFFDHKKRVLFTTASIYAFSRCIRRGALPARCYFWCDNRLYPILDCIIYLGDNKNERIKKR